MLTKREAPNGLTRRIFANKTICFLVLIAAGLIVVGLGLSLRAAGPGALPGVNNSGDLAYLQIEAGDAETIEYVILKQPGMACDAKVFENGGTEIKEGQIEAAIVEDTSTVGLCVRAGYGSGNYLYEKYGDDLSFISLTPEELPLNQDTKDRRHGLRILIGGGSANSSDAQLSKPPTAPPQENCLDGNLEVIPHSHGSYFPNKECHTHPQEKDCGETIWQHTGDDAHNIFTVTASPPCPSAATEQQPDSATRNSTAPTSRAPSDVDLMAPSSAQYVILSHRSMVCNGTAFVGAEPTVVHNGQLIDVSYDNSQHGDGIPPLCFRADYGFGNYVYKAYGIGSGITFVNHPQTLDEVGSGDAALSDITASALAAQELSYVIFVESGKTCSSTSFAIDEDSITYSPPDYPELIVPQEASEYAKALCFRADYGNDLYAYEKYGGQQIKIEPHYKLTLSVEKKNGQLLIRSNTDVAGWRFVRSDQKSFIYNYDHTCNASVFDAARGTPEDESDDEEISLPILRVPTAYDKSPIAEDSGNPDNTLAIELAKEDYGLDYCIEAVDEQGSRAYIGSGVITSDLRVEVVQEGAMLKASTNLPEQNLPEQTAYWQAVKTSGACSSHSFVSRTDQRREPSFELTRRDHNRYYCFKVTDKYGGHVLAKSPLINMAIWPEIELVEQLDNNILMATLGNNLDGWGVVRHLNDWRAVKVDRPVCDEGVIENGTPATEQFAKYSTYQLLSLKPEDVGSYFCFAVEYKGGFSRYRLSERIVVSANPVDGELSIEVRQHGNIVIASANQDVIWLRSFAVENQQECSAQSESESVSSGFGGTTKKPIGYLREEHNGAYYCFGARLADDSNNTGVYAVSPLITGVNSFEAEYPYETPETIDSGQDFIDFLSPYLTDKGMQILDGLDGVYLVDSACGDANGCYFSGTSTIKLEWEGYYNESYDKERYFRRRLETFIHEFMHATDFQDPEIEGLRLRAYDCMELEHDFSEIFFFGVDPQIPLEYEQCLDDSHFLFRSLRNLYDDLPPDSDLGGGRFADYQYLTNIAGRWEGSYGQLASGRHAPRWYTELYAQSVFIRDLPPELEEHYSQYFKNRLDIVEIYEAGLY